MGANKITPEVIDSIANTFLIRASAALEICAGKIGLTEVQQTKYDTYIKRAADYTKGVDKVKDLTDNMKAELSILQSKKDNPELPDGAKTHCKKWLNEYLFKRRKYIKSKYLDKGNIQEEEGFTLMALELNLGMVYKNTQYHKNEYAHGTDDLFVNGVVYDNKCSWELDTFPIWETDIPDEKYEWQLNIYEWLRGVKQGVLAYTLIDCPCELVEREIKWIMEPNAIYKRFCELVYTKDYFDTLVQRFCPMATFEYFVEIPQSDRIRTFPVDYDQSKIDTVKQRVPMCRAFIKELLTKKYIK